MDVVASHSHLFRGAEVVLDGDPAAGAQPVLVLFSDGSEVPAVLLVGDSGDAESLGVEAYTTRAGAAIGAAEWPVQRTERSPDGTRLRLGRREPC